MIIEGDTINSNTMRMSGVPSRGSSWMGKMFPDRYTKYYMLGPTIVYLLLIGIFPLIFSFVLSFLNWDVAAGKPMTFAGLGNYVELIRDLRFWQTLRNTVIFVAAAISLEVIFGFGLALLLNRKLRGQSIFRVLLILPMMTTPVAAWLHLAHAVPCHQWSDQSHLRFIAFTDYAMAIQRPHSTDVDRHHRCLAMDSLCIHNSACWIAVPA